MPSITSQDHHWKPRPDSKDKLRTATGPVVISRDLVLEDLFVDGSNEREEEARRQELIANLKPTDILGPIHETRDFHISSLTRQRPSWNASEPQGEPLNPQEAEVRQRQSLDDQGDPDASKESIQRCYQDSIEEALENDMDESALALKRSYERLFGPNGAVDSERSGSNVGLEAYDNSDDLYGARAEGEGDDECEDVDDYFGQEEEEDIDEQEEYYAMMDLNGGGSNFILGNNIARKPKVIAPPPGSKLPIPRFAQTPKASSTGTTYLSKPTPTGLRPPQVVPKPSISPSPTLDRLLAETGPSILPKTELEPESESPKATAKSSSILDGLWRDLQEQDDVPEQSPGAIFAAQVAAELLKEEEERKAGMQRTKGLRPPQVRSKLRAEVDMDTVAQNLKIESIPNTPTTTTIQPTLARPRSAVSAIPTALTIPNRLQPASTQRSAIPPPKVRGALSTQPSPQSANSNTANGVNSQTSSISRLPVKQTVVTSRIPSRSSVHSPVGSSRGSPQPNTPTPTQSPRVPSRTQLQRDQSLTPTSSPKQSSNPLSMSTSDSEHRRSTLYTQDHSGGSRVRTGNFGASALRADTTRVTTFEKNARASQATNIRPQSRHEDMEPTRRTYSPEPISRNSRRQDQEDRNLARLQRKLQLQKELQEIEEEEEKAAKAQRQRRTSTDRPKLSVRTDSRTSRTNEAELVQPLDAEQQSRRQSFEKRNSVGSPLSPLSPLSPRSPLSTRAFSPRSSMYDGFKDGHRLSRDGHLVPTIEESYKQLAKIRQEIVELRKEVLQVSGSLTTQEDTATTMSPSKQLTSPGYFPGSRRESLDKKYFVQESQSELIRSDSCHDISEPSSPEIMSTIVATPRRKMFGGILGKFRRNSPNSTAGTDANHVIVVDIVVRSWP
ncbi:hypothetical protein BG004_001239 [Podila humilis]|nr:hypothetical protein BG004_001239 [Podila humilis]